MPIYIYLSIYAYMMSFRDYVQMDKMPVNKCVVLLSLRHLLRQTNYR